MRLVDKVYVVVRWIPIHNECCTGFNSQYEKVRMPVDGVYLSKEKAQRAAKSANKDNPANYSRAYVVAYKIKDAESTEDEQQEEQPCSDCAEIKGEWYCTMNCYPRAVRKIYVV